MSAQLMNIANNLQNLLYVIKSKAPKTISKRTISLTRFEQHTAFLQDNPSIEHISQCIADLSNMLKSIFENMDDHSNEQGCQIDNSL